MPILKNNCTSDEELFAFLKAGNEYAYREIYQKYHAALYIFAYKKLQDREECRDIIQTLFINLWQKREDITISQNLSNYLFTAVRNAIFNTLSKDKLKSDYAASIQKFAANYEAPSDYLVRQNQLMEIVNREIDALPARTREIFKLSRFENLSHKEIALKLNVSDATVKTTVNNALKILRVKLGTLHSLFF